MKKKRLFLGLSFAIGALALASCVKKNDSTTNQTKTPDVTKDTPTDVSTPDEQKITITFDVDGKKTSVAVKKGEIPSYSGELKKESTAEFDYEFDGWDKTIVAATEATTYTAKFKETKRQYTYKFVDVDGTELKSEKVKYGTQILAPDTNPEKTDTAEFDYTFDGWYLGNEKVTDFGTVTGDVTYVAKYSSVKNQYTYKFIVDGLVKSTSKEDYGYQIVAPTNPVKESNQEFDYEFDGWYTAEVGGSKVEIFGALNSDVTYYAVFKEIKRQYTYRFVDDDNTELKSVKGDYGTEILAPQSPEKEDTAEFDYTFDGWYLGNEKVTEFGNITGDVTYVAKYSSVKKQYTYTFVVEGVEVDTTAAYGEDIVVPEDPTKSPTVSTVYEFDGWYLGNDKVTEFGTVTGDVTYVAHFKEEVRKYTITFNNYNNELLASIEVEYNTLPEYTGTYPTKPETETEAYEFDGWDNQITEATEAKTYTATFKTISKAEANKYTITFLDDDLTELYTTTVYEGQTPVYNGPEVTKEADARYSYVFTGWDNELVPATQSATYMATYELIANKYTITFLDDDGSVIQSEELEYGYNVSKPDDPQKEDTDEFNYEFIGWYTKATEGELATNYTVLGNQTYYARYSVAKQMYSITFLNDDGNTITVLPLEYGANITAPQTPTKASTQEYSYQFDSWYLGNDKVTNFGTVTGNQTYIAHYTEVKNKYTVTFYQEDGVTVIEALTLEYGSSITAPAAPEKAASAEYFYEFDGWYLNGNKVANLGTVLDNTSYVAHYAELLKLTVTFIVDNDTYTTQTVKEGTKATKPANPTKDGFKFKTWFLLGNEYDFASAVTDNITLVAQFEEVDENIIQEGFGEGFTSWKALVDESGATEDDNGRYILPKAVTIGDYSFAINSGSTRVNANYASYSTQTATITIKMKTAGTIYVEGKWGSDKKTGTVKLNSGSTAVYTSSTISGNGTDISFSQEVAAGTYTLTSDATITISKIYYERTTEFVNVSFESAHDTAPSTRKLEKGDKLGSLPTLSADGYVFLGWFSDENASEAVDENTVINSSMTVYAGWKVYDPSEYVSVSFDGETVGNYAPFTIEKDSKLSADQLPELTKTGYRFKGWYTDGGFNLAFNINNTIGENITLYAKWVKLYTVSFSIDNQIVSTVVLEDGEHLGSTDLPQAPYKPGYVFTSWTLNDASYDIEANAVTSDITLVAKYEVNTDTSHVTIITSAGDLESLYAEFIQFDNSTEYKAYVKQGSGSYTKIDDQLIRYYKGDNYNYYRVDAVGLAAGTYTLKIVPVVNNQEATDNQTEVANLVVKAYDRSGFGFVDGTSSGAYNENGTLKSTANVVYVTNSNKDTVTFAGATGITNIIAAHKKAVTTPLCIRILGNITDPTVLDKGDLLVDGIKVGLTIEGIGTDATINGFGLRIKTSSNVEVRNLGFMNCDSDEGDDCGLQQENNHIWVHNCDYFYGDAGSDSDQVKGDGALDCKKSTYVTFSYNHFWDNGKCNLLGLSEGSTTGYYITYHHNWYDHSDSRHPRVRYYTCHVYNNYYDGNAKYGVGSTLGSSVFVENNYFRNCKYPMMTSLQGSDTYAGGTTEDLKNNPTFSKENGGSIKSYGNTMVGTYTYIPYGATTYVNKGVETAYDLTGTTSTVDFDAYEASSRNEVVPSTVTAKEGAGTYNNFDTNSSMYSYTVQTPEEAKNSVMQYAGRVQGGDFKWSFNNSTDDTADAVNTELKAAIVAYSSRLLSVQSIGEQSSGGSQGGQTDPTPSVTVDDVIALISALPDSTSVTESDRTAIMAAKSAFDSLSQADQNSVTNKDKLAACIAALPEITTFTIDFTKSTAATGTDNATVYDENKILITATKIASIDSSKGLKFNKNYGFIINNNSSSSKSFTLTVIGNGGNKDFTYDGKTATFGTTAITITVTIDAGSSVEFKTTTGGAFLTTIVVS